MGYLTINLLNKFVSFESRRKSIISSDTYSDHLQQKWVRGTGHLPVAAVSWPDRPQLMLPWQPKLPGKIEQLQSQSQGSTGSVERVEELKKRLIKLVFERFQKDIQPAGERRLMIILRVFSCIESCICSHLTQLFFLSVCSSTILLQNQFPSNQKSILNYSGNGEEIRKITWAHVSSSIYEKTMLLQKEVVMLDRHSSRKGFNSTLVGTKFLLLL